MPDKQVIMSKVEFDNMEEELNDLRNVVESKTVCRIAYPKLYWSNIYGRASEIGSYEVEYVIGSDENEVVKELSAEITTLKQTKDDLNGILTLHEASIFRLQRQENDWKNLPWYKRLFV
jgi:septation ring formation regulator EzrA